MWEKDRKKIFQIRVISYNRTVIECLSGSPDGSDDKESACNVGDLSLIPGSGRSAGEGIGYPLQYSWASLMAQMVISGNGCGRTLQEGDKTKKIIQQSSRRRKSNVQKAFILQDSLNVQL